jgi:regulator of sigma E protease
LANLLLAVLLYAGVNWTGVAQPEPVIARPAAGSVLAAAGFSGGERIVRITAEGDSPQDIESFEAFRWLLMRAALERQDLRVEYTERSGSVERTARLALSELGQGGVDDTLLPKRLGLTAPLSVAQLGELVAGGAAQTAGLRRGDRVLEVDRTAIIDAAQLRDIIRAYAPAGTARGQQWTVRRDGVLHSFTVTPQTVLENGATIGRVGAYIGAAPSMVMVRYGLWDGFERAVGRTWEVSLLTVRMIGRMLVGEASLKNLSGPISIADYAGKSAAMGITSYLVFLALISISLGVLNLLPLPVLDGGHLLYYLWEAVSGKPVSDFWMDATQRLGIATLLVMMSVAVFNDVARLVG